MPAHPISPERAEPVALDLINGRIRRGWAIVRLRPKDTAVLQRLMNRPGQLVTKHALMATCWPDVTVTESVLKACVNRLRLALGDDPKTPRFIETVHRRGYRFIGTLPVVDGEALDGLEAAARRAPREFGVRSVVGRAAEIAQLEAALIEAASGNRRVVFISGEAGFGKTTLLDLFVGSRLPAAVLVGRGQCVAQYGAGEAYMPLLEALRRLCDGPDGRDVLPHVIRHAPTWVSQMPGLVPPHDADANRLQTAGITRDRMLREFGDAVDAIARTRLVVLALEDLHWSDAATLDAIALLAHRRDPAPVLVVGTYRPEDTPSLRPFVRDLCVRRLLTEIALPPLNVSAVDAYLSLRFPGASLPAGLTQAAHARTEGHPLFLAALADQWTASGSMRPEDDRWQCHATLSAMIRDVPDDVRQMIEAGLAKLADPERELIEAASVCGGAFSAASVAAALDISVAASEDRCAAIARDRLLLRLEGPETWPDGTVAGRYRFAHVLYRDATYDQVPIARHQRQHRAVADREEAAHGDRTPMVAGRLAMHLEAAGELRRALGHRIAGARHAVSIGGYGQAITHARRGLDLIQRLGDLAAPDELSLQLLLGGALSATEGFAAASAAEAYARARELTEAETDTPALLSALAGLYAYHLMRGPVAAAGEIAEQFLAHAKRTGHSAAIVWGKMALGVQRLQRGDAPEARGLFEDALALYDPSQRPAYLAVHAVDPRIASLGYLSWTLWMLGQPDLAAERGLEAIALADQSGTPVEMAHAHVLQANLHQFLREPDGVRACLGKAIAISTEHGLGQYMSPALILRGWLLATGESPADGLARLRDAIEVWQRSGACYSQPRHLLLLAEACAAAGEPEAAATALADALAAADTSGERFFEPEIHRLRAELLMNVEGTAGRVQRIAEARIACDRALTLARRQGAQALEQRAAISWDRLAGA
ncbi:MAG: AAA family ATPase [Vicinamibacterales bacterium]